AGERSRGKAEKPVVLLAAPRELCGSKPESVEQKEYRHWDQHLVAEEVLFALEKLGRPPDLHDRRAGSGKCAEVKPSLIQRHAKQSGIQQRDVGEQGHWCVLPGR